jgi:hypothetical protein
MDKLMPGVSSEKSTPKYIPFCKVQYWHLLPTITALLYFRSVLSALYDSRFDPVPAFSRFGQGRNENVGSHVTFPDQTDNIRLRFRYPTFVAFLLTEVRQVVTSHCWLAFVWSTFRTPF